jgi:hypothetical protein
VQSSRSFCPRAFFFIISRFDKYYVSTFCVFRVSHSSSLCSFLCPFVCLRLHIHSMCVFDWNSFIRLGILQSRSVPKLTTVRTTNTAQRAAPRTGTFAPPAPSGRVPHDDSHAVELGEDEGGESRSVRGCEEGAGGGGRVEGEVERGGEGG